MAREVRNLCEKDWSSKSDEREVRNLCEKDWSGAPMSGRFATCVKKIGGGEEKWCERRTHKTDSQHDCGFTTVLLQLLVVRAFLCMSRS